MLKSYLEIQRKELEEQGRQRQQLREKTTIEEQRTLSLQNAIVNVCQHRVSPHPLCWQNQQKMVAQLQQLQIHQVQEAALSQIELKHQETLLISKFRQVKGLEILLNKRAAHVEKRGNLQLQRQVDELSSQLFLRRTSSNK